MPMHTITHTPTAIRKEIERARKKASLKIPSRDMLSTVYGRDAYDENDSNLDEIRSLCHLNSTRYA